MNRPEKVQGVVAISRPSKEFLTERQLVAYRGSRESFIEWLRTEGKEPDKRNGYAHDTSKAYASILDKWYRWKWQRDGFTLGLEHEDAAAYLKEQIDAENEYSGSHLSNVKLALKAYFRYHDDEWETDLSISSPSHAMQPRDYATREEREKLREAVIEYGSVPAYRALDPDERHEWKVHLARRFGKPATEVVPADWERANGYKYISIVYVTLDVGLRPIEVNRATTDWLDLENSLLRIPMRQSSKSFDNWTVPITDTTAEYLGLWREERALYDKYDGTDRLWLTRHGNPYKGSSLGVLLDNLRDIANIERSLSWYALRHSTGTYMAREEGLGAAQSILRHKDEKTTMKYDNTPADEMRDAQERM